MSLKFCIVSIASLKDYTKISKNNMVYLSMCPYKTHIKAQNKDASGATCNKELQGIWQGAKTNEKSFGFTLLFCTMAHCFQQHDDDAISI